MRSSSGEHFIALDHVRALAAFMVFAWHFLHAGTGYPISLEYVPSFLFLSLLDEGHTGVALFMTLSGYLFAKLLDGRRIDFRAFLWNRFLRLAPLLLVVIVIVGFVRVASFKDLFAYLRLVAGGVLVPSLPNGGWSITIEFHFYLLLPLFLWLSRKWKPSLLLVILVAVLLRALLHHERGSIQTLTYLSIFGRIDQFLFGMLAFQYRSLVAKQHILGVVGIIIFSLFYWYFNKQGGFYQTIAYPSPSAVWVYLTTVEGFFYALAIAYYDNSFTHSNRGLSRFIGHIGVFSYSIYLFHFFVVFHMARFIHERIIDISNFYLACIWAVICFLLVMPIGYISFRFVEAPLLKLRKRYIL